MNHVFAALDFVPDVAGLRLLNKLPADLSDVEVAEYAYQRRRAQTGFDSLPPHLQKLAGFGFVKRENDAYCVGSVATESERDVLMAFWACSAAASLERWSEFEAPLIPARYRSLQMGLTGVPENSSPALHARIGGAGSELLSLRDVACLAGLPEIEGSNPEQAWLRVLDDDWCALCQKAELRALVACVLHLRFQKMIGLLGEQDYCHEERLLRQSLIRSGAAHLQAFESAWLS